MSAWILVEEPSSLPAESADNALQLALRRQHRGLVILPSTRPGRALVVAIADAPAVGDRGSGEIGEQQPQPSAEVDAASPGAGQFEASQTEQPPAPATPHDASAGSQTHARDDLAAQPGPAAGPRYAATGFLGLVDELVYDEQPAAAKKKWWQKLLD